MSAPTRIFAAIDGSMENFQIGRYSDSAANVALPAAIDVCEKVPHVEVPPCGKVGAQPASTAKA